MVHPRSTVLRRPRAKLAAFIAPRRAIDATPCWEMITAQPMADRIRPLRLGRDGPHGSGRFAPDAQDPAAVRPVPNDSGDADFWKRMLSRSVPNMMPGW